MFYCITEMHILMYKLTRCYANFSAFKAHILHEKQISQPATEPKCHFKVEAHVNYIPSSISWKNL